MNLFNDVDCVRCGHKIRWWQSIYTDPEGIDYHVGCFMEEMTVRRFARMIEKSKIKRMQSLDELTQLSQDMGMYDEDD